MSLTSEKENYSDYNFFAKIDNVKNIYFMLKAINFQEKATCFATENGLKVTVEHSKSIQANAFIQADVFQEYSVLEDPVTFGINLTAVLECMNIFGAAVTSGPADMHTALKIYYKGHGFPLKLLVEGEGVITDSTIRTQDVEELMEFEFSTENVQSRVIIRAEPLNDIFAVLDPTSEVLELTLSPDKPYLRLTTESVGGERCCIDIPKDSDMVEEFQSNAKTTSRYRYAHIKPMIKALSVARKVSLRTNDRMLLCLQLMVKTEDDHVCFIEYYCAPLTDNDLEVSAATLGYRSTIPLLNVEDN